MFKLKRFRVASVLVAVAMALAFSLVAGVGVNVASADPGKNFMVNLAGNTGDMDSFRKVVLAPDGGYVAAGQIDGDTVQVSKFTKLGRLVWSKAFTDVHLTNLNDLAINDSGDVFTTGWVSGTLAGVKSLWVAKLRAADGGVIWEKIVTNGVNSSRGLWVAASPDGGCAVSSQNTVDPLSKEWSVFKLDGDGNLAWAKHYGTPEFNTWCHIIATKDPVTGNPDGYLLAHYDKYMGTSGKNDIVLIKIGLDGTINWAKSYAGKWDAVTPTAENDFPKDFMQTSDGGYVVVGQSYSFSNPDWTKSSRIAFILKVDNGGNISWAKKVGHIDEEGIKEFYSASVCEAANGDLIVAGTTKEFDATDNDAWLLRFNQEDGSLIDDRIYAAENEDYLSTVACIPESGVAAGRSKSFGAGDLDALMMKFGDDLIVTTESDICQGYDPDSPCADALFEIGVPEPHEFEFEGWAAQDWASPQDDLMVDDPDDPDDLFWMVSYICGEPSSGGTTTVVGDLGEGYIELSVPESLQIPLERGKTSCIEDYAEMESDIAWKLDVEDEKAENKGHMVSGDNVLEHSMKVSHDATVVDLETPGGGTLTTGAGSQSVLFELCQEVSSTDPAATGYSITITFTASPTY